MCGKMWKNYVFQILFSVLGCKPWHQWKVQSFHFHRQIILFQESQSQEFALPPKKWSIQNMLTNCRNERKGSTKESTTQIVIYRYTLVPGRKQNTKKHKNTSPILCVRLLEKIFVVSFDLSTIRFFAEKIKFDLPEMSGVSRQSQTQKDCNQMSQSPVRSVSFQRCLLLVHWLQTLRCGVVFTCQLWLVSTTHGQKSRCGVAKNQLTTKDPQQKHMKIRWWYHISYKFHHEKLMAFYRFYRKWICKSPPFSGEAVEPTKDMCFNVPVLLVEKSHHLWGLTKRSNDVRKWSSISIPYHITRNIPDFHTSSTWTSK